MTMEITYNTNIRYNNEGATVIFEDDDGLFVKAFNEGGYCWTTVNVSDLLEWVARHRPEYITRALQTPPQTPLAEALEWLVTCAPRNGFYKVVRDALDG